jgi:iron(III) transport system substrate-binding protein
MNVEIHGTRLVGFGLLLVWLIGGCNRDSSQPNAIQSRVVVYCSVDESFARDVLAKFQGNTGIEVAAIYDSEAGKTTGLVNRIVREAQSGRPGADVFWSGELFGTMRLAQADLLDAYDPPPAADIPPRYRDPRHRWTAFAVRARVLAFDPKRTPAAEVPTQWVDIAKPEIAMHTAIANPLFGTTHGHVAAMFALWSPERGRAFLQSLRDNGALIVDGNSASVRAVIDGHAKFALTDSDDVWAGQRGGTSLDSRPLDMGDGGTLLIPCSVGVVRGGPNALAARRLADFLVSAEVERMLATSDSRNIPVREALRKELDMSAPAESKIGFDQIADAMEESAEAVREILIR